MRIRLTIICSIISLSGFATDTLKIGYYHSPPFVIKNNDRVEGVNMWLWNRISEENNIPYELIEMPLDSMMGEISKGRLDMSLMALTITDKRVRMMNFTPPYFMTNSSFLVKNKKRKESRLGWLKAVLNWQFVKSLGALLLVIGSFGLLLWIFERRKNTGDFGGGIKGIGSGIWWSAVTMTTVGYGDKSPKTTGGRIIATIWMFVAIMIISGFTASIASSLTVDNLNTQTSNISDFKKKKIGTLHESATESWIIDHFFSNSVSYESIEKAMEALKKGEIEAIAYGSPMLRYITQNDSTENFIIPAIEFNTQMYSFGISETLPDQTRENIEYSLLRAMNTKDWKVLLNEYGILEKEE